MELFHNNGLDSVPKDLGREELTGMPNDRGRFRVVTLRNIALTAPYMHDGRFKNLQQVLDHYNEQTGPQFYNRVIILADSKDGKPLEDGIGPFRLVVPDENKPARSAHEVTHLIIRFAKD